MKWLNIPSCCWYGRVGGTRFDIGEICFVQIDYLFCNIFRVKTVYFPKYCGCSARWFRQSVTFEVFWKYPGKGRQFLSCRCIFESVKTSKIWKFTVFSPIPSRFFILQTFEKLHFHKKWHRTLSVFFIKSSFFRRSLIFAWFVLVESSMI